MRRDIRRGIGTLGLVLGGAGLLWTPPALAQGCDAPGVAEHLAAAEKHRATGRYRDAISEYNRAVLAGPECARAKQGVIEANRAMLQRQGAADSPENAVTRHFNLGGAAFDAGDYARAIAEWEAALALEPDNRVAGALIASAREAQVDALIEKGSRLFAAGDTAGATATWEEARTLDPHNPALTELLEEGRAQNTRELEAGLERELEGTMRRIRTEMERQRLLPREDMTGDGMRYRDVSERPVDAAMQAGQDRQAIIAELRNPVSLDFEDTDLRAVLRFLSEVTGINILVDEDVFEELGEVDPDDDEADKQIEVTIFVNELPLESALKGMLRQHGLDFQIQREFLYISTPDVLRASSFEQLEIRYYRLRNSARISLPKLTAEPGRVDEGAGDVEVTNIAGGELISRLRNISALEVLDAPAEAYEFSVARLIMLLRNFIPEVVETATAGGRQQTTATRAADTVVGGWERISQATLPSIAENYVRERKWDSAGREILSRLQYDAQTHTLIAKNTPSNLDLLEEMLSRIDKPTKQVVIESRFLQVDMGDLQRIQTDLSLLGFSAGRSNGVEGSELTASLSSLTGGVGGLFLDGVFGPGVGKLFQLTFAGNDGQMISASIDLLTQLDNTEEVSAPRITTLSGKPAVFQDVRTQTFLTDVEVSTTVIQPPPGTNAAPIIVPEFDFQFTQVVTGVTMTVTPLVLDDNTIRLVLLPDVSNLGNGSTFQVPVTTFTTAGDVEEDSITVQLIEVFRQSLYTNVTVADGETLVLGGLVDTTSQFQERSVPLFRSLPFIGNLFRSTGEFIRRSQLLIFIKCNIVAPDGIAYVRLK